jgi:hypothetical protein
VVATAGAAGRNRAPQPLVAATTARTTAASVSLRLGIQARLRELQAQEPAVLSMVERLLTMVGRFDMKGYMATLKLIREHE